jgi:enoyl-[acyl-carrier protein] reductase I
LDFIIHSIAFAPREALEGEFVATTREAFLTAMEISAYSLPQVALAAAPLMTEGGSIVTMTYYGAEKVVQNYNVMGVAKAALEASTRYLAADLGKNNIRVNAISAGPINTLSARGVKNMGSMLGHVAERAPLKRNVEAKEVGNTALFLVSDLSSGITGETIYVDCGINIIGI